MDKKDCFYLGKITKKYSFKGEIILSLDTDEPNLYQNMLSVFIDLNGKIVPYFIERSSLHKKKSIRIKFEDINSEEEASYLLNKEVYLPINLLPKLEGKKFYYHEITGYKVIDSNHGNIGLIVSVNDASSQSIFVIENMEKQILIPINDKIIERIDRENKTIYISAPNGLIELYLD
tara:strand:- start:1455 stop:1982 length:528 start_codon:yes stop_codon:yes gene_type:complete